MEQRLIDANAFFERIGQIKPKNKQQYEDIGLFMNMITNAPTVPLPDFKEGYKQAILDGQANFERFPGEWIVDEDNVFYNFKKCSNCGVGAEWLDGGSQLLSNFCPNCGAKMQKGGAEE